MTGAFPSQPFGAQAQIQPTGFPPLPFQFTQPSQPTQPLLSSQANSFTIQSQQAPQHRPFSTFVPQQATGLQFGPSPGFLQPQPTGANPFRQSMLIPQASGMPALNGYGIPPVPQTDSLFQLTGNLQSQSPQQPLPPFMQAQQPVPSSTQFGQNPSLEVPARPASTPLTSIVLDPSSTSPPIAQAVKSHQTGSRNPFGAPVTPAPPVPKPPTLLELSMGFGQLGGSQPLPQSQSTATTSPQVQSTTTVTTESTFSTVASSFAFANRPEENASTLGNDLNSLGSPSLIQMAPTTTGSRPSHPFSSPLSSQPTGATASSRAPSIPAAGPIKPQHTGFGGVKPFKPTSSFGASLLDSLPPIPQSGTTTPDPSAQTTIHSSAPSLPTNPTLNGSVYASGNVLGTINPQPTGASFPSQRVNGGFTPGVGLRPQATGALGAANPFRATMFAATSASSTASGVSSTLVSSASTPPFGGLSNGSGVVPAFGPVFGNGAFSPSFTHLGPDSSSMQQHNAGASLI